MLVRKRKRRQAENLTSPACSCRVKVRNFFCAPVAELADALDSGSNRGNSVQVQFLSGAPREYNPNQVFVNCVTGPDFVLY